MADEEVPKLTRKVIPIGTAQRGRHRAKVSQRQLVRDNSTLATQALELQSQIEKLTQQNQRQLRVIVILAERDARQNGRCVIKLDEMNDVGKGDGVDYDVNNETRRVEVIPRRAPREVTDGKSE